MTRSRLRRSARRVATLIAAVSAFSASASAQVASAPRGWSSVTAGSDEELYLRILQNSGALPATGWASRPLSNVVLDSARRHIGTTHPWQSRFAADTAKPHTVLQWRGAAFSGSWNSAFPWGGNDGALWQGRGANALLTSGFLLRFKALTLRAEPQFVYSENTAFDPLPTVVSAAVSPYVDRMRPAAIDLPERFGTRPQQRLDAGESELRIEEHGFAASFSNRVLFLGPAFRNPLILGPNAPGFAHLAFGTTDGIRTPIGQFSGTVVYARLAQSAFAPDKRDGSRLGSAVVISWRPPSGKGVELGAVRFYHRDWPSDGLKFGDLKIPFGSLFGDREVAGTAAPDNQLLSLFARAVSTKMQLELFAEFGRNDRSGGLRDLEVEPEHNSAWSAGFLKSVGLAESGHFWTTRVEYLNGRITSLQRFRPQSTFYEHATITQGHTNLGQVLGSPLLERTGGFEIAVDRWGHAGKIGGMLQQRLMPITGGESVSTIDARSQWALSLNGNYLKGLSNLGWRAGVVRDFNRTLGHDASNFFIGTDVSFGR